MARYDIEASDEAAGALWPTTGAEPAPTPRSTVAWSRVAILVLNVALWALIIAGALWALRAFLHR